MKKLKRILSLVLTSCIFIGMGSDIKSQAQTVEEVAKLEIKVNGKGTVIVDDGYSKYSLEDKDVLRANVTVNSDLKLIVTPDDGYSIYSVNGIDSQVGDSGNTRIYNVTIKSNGTFIDVNFAKETKEEVENNIKEEIKDEAKEKEKEDNNKSENFNEIEKELTEEIIINKYNDGIKMEENLIEARKKLATEKNLLDYVDEDYFLVEEYLKDKSSADLIDKEILILVNSLSNSDIEEFLALKNSKNDFYFKGFRDVLGLKNSNYLSINGRSLVVGNAGAVTEYYNGYAQTAPMLSVGGRQAFCVMFERPDPPGGTIVYNQRINNNEMLRKVLYYGYRGPGTGSISASWSSNQNLLMIATTQAASKANGHTSYSIGNDFYNYVSGLPSPPSRFTVYIVTTGNSTQDLAFWENISKGSLQIYKSSENPLITDGNNCYSIAGAVYGVYKNSNATGEIATLTIGSNGWSQEIQLDTGTYYIKEKTAPKGYSLDKTIYNITVSSGNKAVGKYTDKPLTDPIGLLLRKVDSETNTNNPQGGGTLEGAEFTVKYYAGDYVDRIDPALNGVTATRTWILKTDSNGLINLRDSYKVSGDAFYYDVYGNPEIPFGLITIQETKAPNGYKINSEVFVRKITSNSGGLVVTYNEPIVKEQSLKFTIKKIQSGINIVIPNTKFTHVKPNGSTEILTTGADGTVIIRGVENGIHKIVEEVVVDGYEISKDEFIFEVSGSKINVLQQGSSFIYNNTPDGDGYLTVSNDLKPYKLNLTKVNDKGDILAGAEFTVYTDKDCTNAIETQVSDNKGKLSFSNLEVGKYYYLKETKAPQGYRIPVNILGKVHVYEIYVESIPTQGKFDYYIDGKKYTVNDTNANNDIYLSGTQSEREVNLKVVNISTKKLPKTGSFVMIPLVLIGIGLMSYSLISSKKKNK